MSIDQNENILREVKIKNLKYSIFRSLLEYLREKDLSGLDFPSFNKSIDL